MSQIIKKYSMLTLSVTSALLVFGCSGLKGISDERLNKYVRDAVQANYKANVETQNINVRSVDLRHIEGEHYLGTIVIEKFGNGAVRNIDVKYDGKTIDWMVL